VTLTTHSFRCINADCWGKGIPGTGGEASQKPVPSVPRPPQVRKSSQSGVERTLMEKQLFGR
jgi:hypothetical protein